jgi:hypothetical protein
MFNPPDIPTPPYTNTKSARPTASGAIRLYQDQLNELKKLYGPRTSEVMRLLVDEFLKGRVPAVRTKMMRKGLI